MRTRLLLSALAALLLAACAPTPMRSGEVFDRAKDEVLQAAAERRSADVAEKALLPPLAVEMPKNGEVEPRFDLSVVNASAAQVFMALVTGTRYNMLVNPEVTGQITVRLKDVTVREALESIRELYGYEFTIKGNRISIQPNSLQSRIFQVNYLASKRQGGSDLRVTSGATSGPSGGAGAMSGAAQGAPSTGAQGGGSTGNSTSRVSTTIDSDFWSGLTTALTTIVGSEQGRSVVVNPQSGIVVIRALPRELRSVESYLRATQTIVERQVVLEAKIIDVTLNQEYQSGINWGAFKSGSNSQSAIGVAGPNTNLRTFNSGNVNVTQGYERVIDNNGNLSYV
ncbi:MAG: secretin N-terminal domain-containing protein, partial [Rhodocyclales bacterium]|nr:secretin N-terminal domain-containing protein [Rhodocyclales bacterium]